MGWVVFFVVLYLLYYASEEPAKGIPLIILIVAGFIAFIWWGKHTSTPEYKAKQRKIKIAEGKSMMNNRIEANISAVNRMANGSLFKQLIDDIRDLNKTAYANAAEGQCTYNKKPDANVNMLMFPSLKITNTAIRGNRAILLNEYGYKDLTNEQIELLGMALVKYGNFSIKEYKLEKQELDFSDLETNWDYWKPYVQNYIDIVYRKKRNDYERTHKSVY